MMLYTSIVRILNMNIIYIYISYIVHIHIYIYTYMYMYMGIRYACTPHYAPCLNLSPLPTDSASLSQEAMIPLGAFGVGAST